MRRLFSLAALLALGWSQAVALPCPIAAGADHRHTTADEAGWPSHAATHTVSQSGAPASSDAPCHVAMTCSLTMIDAAASRPGLPLATTPHSPSTRLRTPHAAAYLLADPPPPRLRA